MLLLLLLLMLQVGSLRAGRFYAVRLRAHALADLDSGPVVFDDTYTTSEVLAFRTLPSTPGQMQAPSLARRDRNLLKVRGCETRRGLCVPVFRGSRQC